jgi:tetratricopeptide (TPR) repeat protein
LIRRAENALIRLSRFRSTDKHGMSHSHWTDAEDRARKAWRLMSEHRFAEALDQLRAAVAINPFNADWHFQIGRALDGLHRHEEAIDAYADALDIDPQHLHALNHQGVALTEIGRHAEAIERFEKVQSIDPSFEACYCNRIRCHAERGEHQLAEEMFYTARLYREHCPVCYFNIGQSLAARGLYDRAVFCWQKTIDLSGDDVQVRGRIAHTLWQRGFFDQARRHYLEGLKLQPDHVPTVIDFVSLLVDMNRLDEAQSRLEAVRSHTTDASVSFAWAKLWIARGRWAAAEQCLRRTLQADPTFGGANLLLAQSAVRQDDLIRAKSHLRAELLLRPDSGRTLLELANMLLDVDELRLAVACLKRLTQSEPGNAKAWQNLAVAECTRGRFDKGIEANLRALELDPGNLMIRHNLALAYYEAGEPAYAWEETQYALKLAPHDRPLRRLQFRIRASRVLTALDRLLRGR